jgi:hypothetical protein
MLKDAATNYFAARSIIKSNKFSNYSKDIAKIGFYDSVCLSIVIFNANNHISWLI